MSPNVTHAIEYGLVLSGIVSAHLLAVLQANAEIPLVLVGSAFFAAFVSIISPLGL